MSGDPQPDPLDEPVAETPSAPESPPENSSSTPASVDEAETAAANSTGATAAADLASPPVRYRYVRLRPHRGHTILGLGISGVVLAIFGSMMALSLYFCCPLWLLPLASLGLSIPAWNMGQSDLSAMYARQMDPTGREVTTVGMICGIIGVSIVALGATVILLIVAIYAVMLAISAASS